MDVAIISIGDAFNPTTNGLHKKEAEMKGFVQPQIQPDGS